MSRGDDERRSCGRSGDCGCTTRPGGGCRCWSVAGGLQLSGLTRRFGSLTALDGLSFSVPPGQVVGFLGPNGAGKTTTMRADLRAHRPRRRHRSVERGAGGSGRSPSLRLHARGAGPVPGDARRRAGRVPRPVARAERGRRRTRRHAWLDRLGIGDRADSKVDALSHGNQQRVQLAAALVHEPELLVLDEPLAGLDPVGHRRHRRGAGRAGSAGCCVLFSSHQLDLVEDLCESVTIIDHGRLVVTGTVDDLATAGARRLVVRVDGDRNASLGARPCRRHRVRGHRWRGSARAPRVGRQRRGAAGGDGPPGGSPSSSFERRRLSEVFREALA